jgi:hypothetical protein
VSPIDRPPRLDSSLGGARACAPVAPTATPDEDRRGGFERGGWLIPPSDDGIGAFVDDVYARADAFLFGRRTFEIFAGSWGMMKDSTQSPVGQGTRLFPDTGPDVTLDLVDTRTTPSGVTIQVFRLSGRPEYATSAAKAGMVPRRRRRAD